MMLKKKVVVINAHNKVESKLYIAVSGAKSVAKFHASLILVREEAGAQLSNKDIKQSISHKSKHLQEGRYCKKYDALI